MGTQYNTSIILNDLVYHVDFANAKMYPGNGDTITSPLTGLNSSYHLNTGNLYYDTTDKTMYRSTANVGADHFQTDQNVLLGPNFTMHALVKLTATAGTSAQGILTNHNHASYTGAGITARYIATGDMRISCNTGTGSYRPAFKMSMAAVYDRALTDNEIKQNFNAVRGRFGL